MFIRNFWYLKIQRCVVYLFACQFWETQSRTFKTFWFIAERLCVRPEGKKTLPQSLQGPNVVRLCVGPWHWKINKHTALPTFLKTRRWSRWKRGATAGRSWDKHRANLPATRFPLENVPNKSFQNVRSNSKKRNENDLIRWDKQRDRGGHRKRWAERRTQILQQLEHINAFTGKQKRKAMNSQTQNRNNTRENVEGNSWRRLAEQRKT